MNKHKFRFETKYNHEISRRHPNTKFEVVYAIAKTKWDWKERHIRHF